MNVARLMPPRRDVLIAAGCFALGTVLYLADFYAMFGDRERDLIGWHVVVLGVACAAQLWRTRAPLPALAGGLLAVGADVVLGASLPVLLVLADLLYTATLHTRPRTSKVVIGSVAVVVVAAGIAGPVLAYDWRVVLLAPLQVGVIPVWWARNVRQHREAAQAERARAEQLERIAELDRRAAVAEERARMARELHDVVAGQLSAIAIQSEALLSGSGKDADTVHTVLGSVRENSVAALREMRTMIDVLRAGETESTAVPARLRDLDPLVESATASGLHVEVRTEPGLDLPAAVDITAYRIVQEALTNAAKHAPGAHTRIALRSGPDRLIVEVSNDGLPDTEPGSGMGLFSMRERAQAIGGTLTAGPCADRWRVRAELPIGGTP